MYVLTKEEIRYITETVDKAGITFSHLPDDLVDHLCCEIEHEMENGLTFHQALKKMKTEIGANDLQHVQEDVLLLTDKKYRIMKTTMKLSGTISTSLLMIGSLFKIMHWPGATIILMLGFALLGLLFLPSAMYVMHKENKDIKKPLMFVFAFLGSFGFTMGVFFKIMHWPGASVLLIAGNAILSLLFLPALLIFLYSRADKQKEKRIYTLGVVSGIIYFTGFLFKMMHWPGASILLVSGALTLLFLFAIPYALHRYKNESHIQHSFIYFISAVAWFLLITMLIALKPNAKEKEPENNKAEVEQSSQSQIQQQKNQQSTDNIEINFIWEQKTKH